MKERIHIIGGGPAGLFAAECLSKEGYRPVVFEEHKSIGRPVQCTGIVTESIKKAVRLPEECVVNKLKSVRVHAGDTSAEFPIRDMVIDRTAFDRALGQRAECLGADVRLGRRINRLSELPRPGIVIGADGPASIVRKALNPDRPPRMMVARQVRARGSFESDTFSICLGTVAPGFFAWKVPESDKVARVGIGGAGPGLGQRLHAFLKMQGIGQKSIIEHTGGVIPVYDPLLKVQSKPARYSRAWPGISYQGHKGTGQKLYIVGDAAAQVKATTGGGLVPGLLAAGILARSIADKADYRKRLMPARRNLWLHLRLRQALDRFSDRDYEELIGSLDKRPVREALARHSRDSPMLLLARLAIAQPGLIRHAARRAF